MVLPIHQEISLGGQGAFEHYLALHDAALDKAYSNVLEQVPMTKDPDISLDLLPPDIRNERKPRLAVKRMEYEERLSRYKENPYLSPEQQRIEKNKFAHNIAARDMLRIVLIRGGVDTSALHAAYQNMAASNQVKYLPAVFDNSCAVIARYVYTGSAGNKPLPPA